jgi:tetratricopeptide (TPR) repeat protein
MSSIEAREARYDLGVLFVHGIGQRAQGETLLQFGEPLRAAIERLAAPASNGPDAGTPAARLTSVASAWLSDAAGGGPARAELEISGVHRAGAGAGQSDTRASRSRWLLAEAWWAEKFPTPTYAEIASWSFGALPATLISHFDRRFRRVGFALIRALRGRSSLAALLEAVARLVAEGAVLALALTLTPLLLSAIAMLLVLGLPPFPATRDLAGALQRKIAATVGDSYVFMHQHITAATIATSVQERLEWLAARCRTVAVLAHSQGGAIAHRVLRGRVTAPCDLFVTFGSGLAKLSEMERGEANRGRGMLWMATLGSMTAAAAVIVFLARGWAAAPGPVGLLTGVFWPFVVVELGALLLFFRYSMLALEGMTAASARAVGTSRASGGGRAGIARPWRPLAFAALAGGVVFVQRFGALAHYPHISIAWVDVVLALLIALGLGIAFEALTAWHGVSGRSMDPEQQWLRDRELYRDAFELRNRRLSWYDLHASADPVPNGSLLDDYEPKGLISVPVHNAHSMLFDHTSYWKATDDFVQRVARLLMALSGVGERMLKPQRAIRRRRWRVGCLTWARRMLGLAALALAAQWMASQPAVFERTYVSAAATLGWGRAWTALKDDVAPLLAVILAWFAFRVGLHLGWRAWNAAEVEDYFRGRDYTLNAGGFWFTLLWPAAFAGWAAHQLAGPAGLAVFAILAVALLVSALALDPVRDFLALKSASGAAERLDRLELASLRAAHRKAMQRGDPGTLTSIGIGLQGLDDALATKALAAAAFEFNSPNAALELGRLHERAAHRAQSEPERNESLRLAVDAYARGVALGDPVSAWWAAYLLDRSGRADEAADFHRRAFELGDPGAAHSLGLRLIQRSRETPALRDEARRIYEEGLRRGDALSASFLAGHFEAMAREAAGDEAGALNRQAVELYRRAFDLGDVSAALQAGNLLRRMGDIPAARRAYTLGTRMRDASAALALGRLEQVEEQNHDAARNAFREAVRLDARGPVKAEALVALGGLLEQQERPNAAMARYREALMTDDGQWASAEAGLALARLLERQDDWSKREEIAPVLMRAAALAPFVAGDAYVEYLERTHDREAAAAVTARHVDGLSAHGRVVLARLLRHADAERSRALLEGAFALGLPARGADEAAAEWYAQRWMEGDTAAAGRVLEEIVSRGPFFAGKVADLLEKDGFSSLARSLRQAADARDAPREPTEPVTGGRLDGLLASPSSRPGSAGPPSREDHPGSHDPSAR